jgi:dTDP-4-amino-4,6-dideoxygalactose transaminase
MADMEKFISIIKNYPLPVVEDATEAIGTTYKGKSAGRFSPMGCFSFNGNKIISTGGGGVIITDDEYLAKKAKHLTTTAKASPDEYYHDEVGYNYRLVNVLAAIGVGQMELLPAFIKRKKQCIAYYKKELTSIGDIRFQKELPGVETNGWLFTIQTENQNLLLKHMNANNILCRRFWMPMNKLPMYKNCVYVQQNDQADYIYKTCLSIPSSTGITDEELEIVVREIKEAMG